MTVQYQGVDEIHRLRVAIKELKALLALIELSGNGRFDKKDHLDLFDKVFRTAGKVREAHLNAEIAGKKDKDCVSPYLKHLYKSQKRNTQKLVKAIANFDIKELDRIDLNMQLNTTGLNDKMVVDRAMLFVLAKLKKVNSLKSDVYNNKKLHKLRINLKAASGILSLADELHPSEVWSDFQDRIKSIYKLLGKWHDHIVLIDSLKAYVMKVKKNKKNISKIKSFVKQLKKKNEKRRSKINDLLTNYFSQEELTPVEANLEPIASVVYEGNYFD